jgi:hypothetical protein
MTEKQFFASKWKPFEVMNVFIKSLDRDVRCYLVGVNFETRTMKLRPIDSEIYYDHIFKAKIDIIGRGEGNVKMRILK